MSAANQQRLFRAAPVLAWVLFALLCLCALPLALVAADNVLPVPIPGAEHVQTAVEWARQKDIVTLALSVSVLLIIFSAWLVKLTLTQSMKHWENATASIEGLRSALVGVRCPALETRIPPPPPPRQATGP